MSRTEDIADLVALPDEHKRRLAMDLLTDLGATNIRVQGDELVHGCLVCPHHTDQARNPTASLNWRKWLYNCLSGGGGSVLWLIATVHDELTTIEQARAWLAGQAGINQAMPLAEHLALLDSITTVHHTEPIPTYADAVLSPWKDNQPGDLAEVMAARRITRESAQEAELCIAPAGALVKNGGPRLVIPHRWNGTLVGWQSRRLVEDGTPKYLSTPAFPKDETIYNHQPGEEVVVVEAPMSVNTHRHVLPMAATFGAEVTETQLRLLAAYPKVIFWFDPDPGGWNAVESYLDDRGRYHTGLAEQLSPYTSVDIVESPFDADPGEMPHDLAAVLVAECSVPWAVWQRPAHLYCLRCERPSHKPEPCSP